jgi:hypothetical protein
VQRFTGRSDAGARRLIRANVSHDEVAPALTVKRISFASRQALSLFGFRDFHVLNIPSSKRSKNFS